MLPVVVARSFSDGTAIRYECNVLVNDSMTLSQGLDHCSGVHKITPLLCGIAWILSWTMVGTKTRRVLWSGARMRCTIALLATPAVADAWKGNQWLRMHVRVCPYCTRKTAWAINAKLGCNTVHGCRTVIKCILWVCMSIGLLWFYGCCCLARSWQSVWMTSGFPIMGFL